MEIVFQSDQLWQFISLQMFIGNVPNFAMDQIHWHLRHNICERQPTFGLCHLLMELQNVTDHADVSVLNRTK